MVNKKDYHTFIFTHIPKCGGTSFRKYVYDCAISSGVQDQHLYIPGMGSVPFDKNLSQLSEEELGVVANKNLRVLANHSKYDEHIELGIHLADPFYYTILRNPLERFVSHYNFFYFRNGLDGCKGIHLDDLSEEKLVHFIKKLSNIQIKYLANVKHIKSIGLRNLYKLAVFNIQNEYGCFGIIEDMNTSISILKNNAPDWIKFSNEFPVLNVYKQPKEVSQRVLDIFITENEYDILFYDYAKVLFSLMKERQYISYL